MVSQEPTAQQGTPPSEPEAALEPVPAPEPAADAALGAPTASARRRRPPSRLSAEVLEAGRRSGAREGLEWLGREPEARASLLYRCLRLLARFILFGLCRLHVETSGQEHLPKGGGYLLIAAAHRGWIDPFVVMHAIPPEPRAWILGSGPSTFTARWRERLIHRVGGLLPVWRGGLGIDVHVESARAVIRNGAVFVQMPEGTLSGPPGRIIPFRHGASLIALRTGAPIVPVVMAGTETLYIGHRMATKVLPVVTIASLLGDTWDGVLPPEDSREELALAHRVTAALEALFGPEVEALQPRTVDPPGRRRLLERRLTWLFMRPGRLDRDEA